MPEWLLAHQGDTRFCLESPLDSIPKTPGGPSEFSAEFSRQGFSGFHSGFPPGLAPFFIASAKPPELSPLLSPLFIGVITGVFTVVYSLHDPLFYSYRKTPGVICALFANIADVRVIPGPGLCRTVSEASATPPTPPAFQGRCKH